MASHKNSKKQAIHSAQSITPIQEDNLIVAEEKRKTKSVKNKSYLVVFVVFILALIAFIYFFVRYEQVKTQLDNNSGINQSSAVVEAVGKLIELPGESPQIATITDINKLKGQTFFMRAKNGDKVLIYSNANEAIIYDPVENKLVNVGTLNISQAAAVTLTPTPTPVTAALYNGTDIIGFTKVIQTKLNNTYPQIQITSKQNAVNNSYQTTTLIDLSNTNGVLLKQLANYLHGNISTIPKGEARPSNAQILIILGASSK